MNVEYINSEDDKTIKNVFSIAHYDHKRSILFCSDWEQVTRLVIPKLHELLRIGSDDLPGGRFPSHYRRFEFYNGSILQLGVLKHIDDSMKYQGRMFDAMFFYDAQNISQDEVLKVLGWLRTTDSDQSCESYFYYRNTSDKVLMMPNTLAS